MLDRGMYFIGLCYMLEKKKNSTFEGPETNSSNTVHAFAIATVISNVILRQYRGQRSRSPDITMLSHEIRNNIALAK